MGWRGVFIFCLFALPIAARCPDDLAEQAYVNLGPLEGIEKWGPAIQHAYERGDNFFFADTNESAVRNVQYPKQIAALLRNCGLRWTSMEARRMTQSKSILAKWVIVFSVEQKNPNLQEGPIDFRDAD